MTVDSLLETPGKTRNFLNQPDIYEVSGNLPSQIKMTKI